MRTSVQKAVGGYDPDCYHASDLNMWLRMAAVSDVAYIRGAPQAVYRVHGDSMLRSAHNPLTDLRERRKAFDSFFTNGAATVPNAAALRTWPRGDGPAGAVARQPGDRPRSRGRPDGYPFDELLAFALDVYDGTRSLREWHGLRLRRRIGAGRSSYFPLFLATGAAHRLRGHAARARWARMGV